MVVVVVVVVEIVVITANESIVTFHDFSRVPLTFCTRKSDKSYVKRKDRKQRGKRRHWGCIVYAVWRVWSEELDGG